MTEWWRRVLLAAAVATGAWLWFLADLAPLVRLEAVDFAKRQERHGGTAGALVEESRRMRALTPESFVQELTRNRTLEVTGPAWSAFFPTVLDASARGTVPPEWRDRALEHERGRGHGPVSLFFRLDESPLDELSGRTKPSEERFLTLAGEAPPRFLAAWPRSLSDDDFQLGRGLSGYDAPAEMVFRLRPWVPWVLAAGLALYVLLPWPRRPPGAIVFSRWRVVLGDLVGILLFGMFFSLPFFIVGGSVQALRDTWGFPLVLWPLAALGLLALWFGARYSAYAIEVLPGGLRVSGIGPALDLPFTEVRSFRPATLRAPRWLVRALWVAALFGKGRGAGQALILGSSETGGLALELRDGRRVFLWATDAMGNLAMRGFERVIEGLRAAGVRELDEPIERRAMLPPDVEGPGVRGTPAFGLTLMVLAPGLLAAAIGAWLSRTEPAPAVPVGQGAASGEREAAPGAATPAGAPGDAGLLHRTPTPALPGRALGPGDIAWEVVREVPDAAVTRGTALLTRPGGGVLVAGEVGFLDLNATDVYALALGPAGEIAWETRREQPWEDACAAVAALPGGGYLLAGDAKVDDRLASDLDLVALEEGGTERWRRRRGQEGRYERAAGLAAADDGYLVVGSTERGVDVALSPAGELVPRVRAPAGAAYLVKLDGEGRPLREESLPGAGTAGLQAIAATGEGGFVAAGWTERRDEDFIDAYLVGLDREGRVTWERSFGGPGTQKAAALTVLANGDLALTGRASVSGRRAPALWLTRTDARGEPRWTRTWDTGDLEGVAVMADAGDGLRVVGRGRAQGGRDFLYLLRTDGAGQVREEAHYAPGDAGLTPYAALALPDGGLHVTGQRGTALFALKMR